MAPETWSSRAFEHVQLGGLLLLLGLQLLLLLELVAEGVTAGRIGLGRGRECGPGGHQGDDREGQGAPRTASS